MVGLPIWLTWPRGGQLDTKTCLPELFIANMSARLHGERFWEIQLNDVRQRLAKVQNWDQAQAEQQRRIEPLLRKGDEALRAANENLIELAEGG